MKTVLTEDLLNTAISKRGILVTGGDAPSESLLIKARQQNPDALLYCADSGADAVVKAGWVPDAVLGDMDSIAPETLAQLKALNVPQTVLSPDKNATDTHLALNAMFAKGLQEILVLGATGSRLDHELANLMLVIGFGRQNKSVVLWDEQNRMRYVNAGIYAVPAVDAAISLVPIDVKGMRLSLQGFKYPLDNALEPFGLSRLISNCWKEEVGRITIHSGDGFLTVSDEKANEKERTL